MRSVHRPSRSILVLLVLGVLQHAVPPGANAQVSETGPPLAKLVRNATAASWGTGALLVTPVPHAGVGSPSLTPPGPPRGEQSVP